MLQRKININNYFSSSCAKFLAAKITQKSGHKDQHSERYRYKNRLCHYSLCINGQCSIKRLRQQRIVKRRKGQTDAVYYAKESI